MKPEIKNIKKAAERIKKAVKNKEKIGQELGEGSTELWQKEREENTLTKCPKCKKGDLRILYNKKSKRYFIACNAYPECKTTFSLPPNGLMKPAIKDEQKELCPLCGFPLILSIRAGKRPWKFCFNPNCESRKQRTASEDNKNKEEMQDETNEEKKEE